MDHKPLTPLTHKQFDDPKFYNSKHGFNYGSIIEGKVNPDLQEERNKCNFDQNELTRILYNKDYDRHKKWMAWFKSHPEIFAGPQLYDMDREDAMQHMMKVAKVIRSSPDIYDELKEGGYVKMFNIMDYLQGQKPNTISLSMFCHTVRNLGTKEQADQYVKGAGAQKLYGCYAQTELGHGSNIAGLETTATLDKKTDEFVLNTPTLTAWKFWPGELGKFATHAVVAARLIIDDNDYGVRFFITPIRSLESHLPFPGLEIGELGAKFGLHTKDNGYMKFDQYRIPRENLLARFCKVDKEGNISLDGDPRILYATMMSIRIWIVSTAWKESSVASLIATRYACTRRQFQTTDQKGLERKLIDYQSHQFKLIPAVAQTFVLNLSQNHINEFYEEFVSMISSGQSEDFKPLAVIHHLVSGLKAFFTSNTFQLLNNLREACGGAGFSQFSGLPFLMGDYAARVAYEGDNVVMLQQSAKYLMNSVLKNKKMVSEYLTYLENLEQQFATLPRKNGNAKIDSLDAIGEALRVRSAYFIYAQVLKRFQTDKETGINSKVLLNEMYQQDQLTMGTYHLAYYAFWSARMHLSTKVKIACPNLKAHLENLLCVYGLNELQKDSAQLYDCGYFTKDLGHTQVLQTMKDKFTSLRPQLVSIIEAIDIPDTNVNSSIGNSYGDIYEHYINNARNSKLNQSAFPKGLKEHMFPVILSKEPLAKL